MEAGKRNIQDIIKNMSFVLELAKNYSQLVKKLRQAKWNV